MGQKFSLKNYDPTKYEYGVNKAESSVRNFQTPFKSLTESFPIENVDSFTIKCKPAKGDGKVMSYKEFLDSIE